MVTVENEGKTGHKVHVDVARGPFTAKGSMKQMMDAEVGAENALLENLEHGNDVEYDSHSSDEGW